METKTKNMAEMIKMIRSSLGLTQTEFAEKIGATLPAVSNWENGRNQPNKQRLKQIAKVAGITVEELLNNEKKSYYEEIEDIVNECLSEYDGAIGDEYKKDILNETLVRFFQSSIRNKDKVKRFVERLLNNENPNTYYDVYLQIEGIDTTDKHFLNAQKAFNSFKYIIFPVEEVKNVYLMNKFENANISDGIGLYNLYLDRYNSLNDYYLNNKDLPSVNDDEVIEIEQELSRIKTTLTRMKKYIDF